MGGGYNNSDFSLLGRKIGAAHGAVISYSFCKIKSASGRYRESGRKTIPKSKPHHERNAIPFSRRKRACFSFPNIIKSYGGGIIPISGRNTIYGLEIQLYSIQAVYFKRFDISYTKRIVRKLLHIATAYSNSICQSQQNRPQKTVHIFVAT